ncbi:HIV Tat-specific factor 1 [Cichlidogyrus casuarinus]|uniref:HIV Tat-specific factor 1 n=1 Tax=Cichlidogyrus casuarinus TaxID=1844966 RepID=A0ABD2PWK1_9PLAT
MSKCGLIAHDPLTEKPRMKLYRNADGTLKGDGRCCYIKLESVELALQILDGMQLDDKHTIRVEKAKFQPKGEYDPNKRRRLTQKEKKKMKAKEESLFKWGMEANRFIRTKKERTIVLKNVFEECDFSEDVTLIPTVKELVRVQCAKCGSIKKINVYDTNKEGVVTVTYHTADEADAAISFLDRALFSYTTNDGRHQARQLQVSRSDGKTRFDVKETEEEEAARLARWNQFLEEKNEEQANSSDEASLGGSTPSSNSEAGGTDDELED